MIDLRSDTVTQPTDEMRRAMAEAPVGDDVYGDDPTVNRLEELAAKIIGKEAAMFVVSGTMGNQLAVMTHTKRSDEVILGKNSHIVHYECGAASALSQVGFAQVDNPNGFIYPEDVVNNFRGNDLHFPETGLLCLENALAGGRVVPLEIMKATTDEAHKRGVPVHLDGARIFNAALSLGIEAKEIAACCDSVMFCLSKGLCAPVGSILAGSKAFIAKARRNRKMLGGGMRQAGVLAAPGIIALEKMTLRLGEDHDNAKYLAQKLQSLEFVECKPEESEINMVFFNVMKAGFNPSTYMSHMAAKNIKVSGEVSPGRYRFVTHHGISKQDIDFVVDSLREIL
ncbi:MAG: low-specificity L-threonine aldolase [Treponema sp.]|jgi:threonine aldolase|nr:low-specificity L-threonine aldolase [Treponema sp.]